MPRLIDSIPDPSHPLEKKVIVLSYPRNGTLGLYKAFQMLGYRPYHFVTCFRNGIPHVTIATEAVDAKYNGNGQLFGKREFDKWWAENDVIIDVSAFFVTDLVEAYPDAKFILTYREPDAWLRSIHNTFVKLGKAQDRFPLWYIRQIDGFTAAFYTLTRALAVVMWESPTEREGPEADRRVLEKYRQHNELVRKVVPRDQLLEVKLEDGLGWEQICPFLECDIPSEPYPRQNMPDEFRKTAQGFFRKHWAETARRYAAVIVPLAGVAVWYFTARK